MVNLIARGLMRTPLLARVVGKGLITLYVAGRRTGKRYTVPTAYVRSTEPRRRQDQWDRIDRDGEPDPNDLRAAWAAGPRVFRLTLS